MTDNISWDLFVLIFIVASLLITGENKTKTKSQRNNFTSLLPYSEKTQRSTVFNPLLCVCPCVCRLAGSAATEERFTAESVGRLLQGAAGTTGGEGTAFTQTHTHAHTHTHTGF